MDLDPVEMANEIKIKIILHWNYRDLEELPEALRLYGGHIQEIYLKWNNLTTLPAWIVELFNLTDLYLYGNQIEHLPMEFGRMNQLTMLDLSANRLQLIPPCIGSLSNLVCLFLDDNFIERLSVELSQLNNLKVLSLSGNQIVTLPEWIGSLPKLSELYMDKNQLRELPNRLTIAPNLVVISVRSNRLTYLPLNGFLSQPTILFDANEYLNYVSYPILIQAMSSLYAPIISGEHFVTPGFFKKHYDTDVLRTNIKLYIKTKHDIIIELPRQLLKVHKIHEKETCSLWELAMRKIYIGRYKHTLNISDLPEGNTATVSYEPLFKNIKLDFILSKNFTLQDLFTNGPISICVNSQCQQPIFTEAWIIVDIKPVVTIALCCSRSCAIAFVHLNTNNNRDWHSNWQFMNSPKIFN